jgi:hypothetical protein
MRAGTGAGMQIPNPTFELMEANQLEEKMQQFRDRKFNFLMYIDNKYTKSHCKILA